MRTPKHQHLTTLLRTLDNTSRRLSVHAPIITIPGLINLNLALSFCLYQGNNLGMELHQFKISQETFSAWKVLESWANQHQVFAGSSAATFVADAAILMAPDGVSMLATLVMAQGSHAQLRVVMFSLFKPDHPTALEMRDVNTNIMEREIELE